VLAAFIGVVPTMLADQPLRGVAGVEVQVKEQPSKHAITDARGNFVLKGFTPGSYALLFKAQKAKDTKSTPASTVAVAQSYSIVLQGTKQPISHGATPNQLSAGLVIPVQVGAGATVHGMIGTTQAKQMVWIAPMPGTHFQGHWVPADSPEAKGHTAHPTNWMKPGDVQTMLDSHDPFHQENFPASPGTGR